MIIKFKSNAIFIESEPVSIWKGSSAPAPVVVTIISLSLLESSMQNLLKVSGRAFDELNEQREKY